MRLQSAGKLAAGKLSQMCSIITSRLFRDTHHIQPLFAYLHMSKEATSSCESKFDGNWCVVSSRGHIAATSRGCGCIICAKKGLIMPGLTVFPQRVSVAMPRPFHHSAPQAFLLVQIPGNSNHSSWKHPTAVPAVKRCPPHPRHPKQPVPGDGWFELRPQKVTGSLVSYIVYIYMYTLYIYILYIYYIIYIPCMPLCSFWLLM